MLARSVAVKVGAPTREPTLLFASLCPMGQVTLVTVAHRCTVDVRFNELDPYNHVNHSTYVTYFEVGRAAALKDCGVPLEDLTERGVHVFIASLEVKYLAPASAGQRLVVETRQEPQQRRASTLWNQTVLHEGVPLVTANVLGAFVNLDGRPMRRPDWLDDALGKLENTRLGDLSLF